MSDDATRQQSAQTVSSRQRGDQSERMWSQKTSGMPDVLFNYVVGHIREDELLVRLRRETAAMPKSQMQISPDEGQLISFMVKLIGVRPAWAAGGGRCDRGLTRRLAPSRARAVVGASRPRNALK